MKVNNYKKNRVATAITCALMPILFSTAAIAEESAAKKAQKEKDEMEVIEIKSFKDSVASSLNNKRGSNSIIDAINADDIGNFPDSNVAESLQRVPGVSITRSLDGSGEGISIRGFSAGKNLTLINGQQWQSSGFNLENALSRGSNFSLLPSAVVSRAEVYKSSEARLPDGGVGGTANIITHKPLSQKDDFFGKLSAKAKYNTLVEETAPVLSGIASWKFDDKFGALISVDYSDINTRREAVEVLKYDPKTLSTTEGDSFAKVDVPGAIGSAQFNQNRERKTAMVAMQLRPVDSVDMNLMYLTSEMSGNNLNTNLISLNHGGFVNGYYKNGKIISADIDESLRRTGYDEEDKEFFIDTIDDITYPAFKPNTGQRAGQISAIYREAELTSDVLQFDASWIGDNATLKASAGYSKSSGGPGYIRVLPIFIDGRSQVSINDGVGYVKYLDADNAELGRGEGRLWNLGSNNQTNDNENNYVAFDGEFYLDDGLITSIEFGVKQTNAEQNNLFDQLDNNFHQDALDEDGNLLRESYRGKSPTDLADVISTPDGFLDGISDNAIDQYFYLHPADAEHITFTSNYMHRNRLGKTWKLEETISAAYVQANFEHEFSDFILRGNAGLRYSEQETTTYNFYQSAFADDDDIVEDIETLTPEMVENFNYNYIRTAKTDELLPSLNLVFDFESDWIVRAAYSTVISRPAFGQLAQQLSLGKADDDASLSGSRGNHALEPFKADKYDLSFEWYYKEASTVSLAYFYFDIATLVTSEMSVERFFGFDFDITKPVNVDGGTINGLEFAVSHVFDELPAPFDGLGTQFNYTYVDSDSEEINPDTGASLPLAGLSENTYNFILFYSKNEWDARLTYNYRDAYYEQIQAGFARYNDEIGRLDAKVKYKFSNNLSMFVQGTNLTDQKNKRYADIPGRPFQTSLLGRNYTVGIDYKF